MILTDHRILTRLGVSARHAGRYMPDLQEWCPVVGIDTPLRLQHFLAQCLHESALMSRTTENLNAEGLGANAAGRRAASSFCSVPSRCSTSRMND